MMRKPELPPRPAAYDKKVALVLQGGGALGSYQAGVYEALAGSDYLPDWIAGISIGAINAAIIAGNPPERRVARLREFWERITTPAVSWAAWLDGFLPQWPAQRRRMGAASALAFGQAGFFAWHSPFDWVSTQGPTSFYATTALRSTLEELVDFDRLNSGETRLSVGAVNVRTGNFAYFDTAETRIRPEHIMASGALPPGFPAVEIDGERYWDGGLVSNTPLQYVLEKVPRRSRLTFQVDVFPARGPVPQTLVDVAEREKDIRYSSRTRAATDTVRQMHDVRHNINALWEKLPEELRATPEARWLYEFGCVTTMDIAQLIYRPEEVQGHSKDYDFSRGTMEERWAQGREDALLTLAAAPWLAPMPPEVGARTFDVPGERLRRAKAPPMPPAPALPAPAEPPPPAANAPAPRRARA
jgi:NTE family protein